MTIRSLQQLQTHILRSATLSTDQLLHTHPEFCKTCKVPPPKRGITQCNFTVQSPLQRGSRATAMTRIWVLSHSSTVSILIFDTPRLCSLGVTCWRISRVLYVCISFNAYYSYS